MTNKLPSALKLTTLERKVLKFITQHPGITITDMYTEPQRSEYHKLTTHRPYFILNALGSLHRAGWVNTSDEPYSYTSPWTATPDKVIATNR